MFVEIILIFGIVVVGTGGEFCLTRAMKTIGEVHDFRPRALLNVFGRAMRVGWMWLALLLMAAGFFSLLGMLSLENVSFVVPVTALSYAGRQLTAGRFSRRESYAAALARRSACVYWRDDGVEGPRLKRLSGKDSRVTAWGAIRAALLLVALAPFGYYIVAIIAARRFFAKRAIPLARGYLHAAGQSFARNRFTVWIARRMRITRAFAARIILSLKFSFASPMTAIPPFR